MSRKPKLTIKTIGQPKEIYAFLSRLQMFYEQECIEVSKLHKNTGDENYHLFVNIFQEPI